MYDSTFRGPYPNYNIHNKYSLKISFNLHFAREVDQEHRNQTSSNFKFLPVGFANSCEVKYGRGWFIEVPVTYHKYCLKVITI